MFYDHYEELCKKVNKKPYTVAREIGLGTSNVAQWKKGSTPRPDILQKLSDYFGVSKSVLLGFSDNEKKETPAPESAEFSPEDIRKLLSAMTTAEIATLMADAAEELKRRG